MIAFVKKLWRDKRGNAVMIAAASLPLLMGSVGLATDTIQWTLWKRELQRAADSAALAGSYSRYEGGTSSSAVSQDLTSTAHGWRPGQTRTTPSLLGGYPQVSDLPNTTAYSAGVQVTLAVQRQLSFSSMFMSAAPIITTTARAAAIDQGDFCVVALENGTTSGITIGGSANVNMGCGIISNSISIDEAIDSNGNAYSLIASPVAGSGGLPAASLASHGATNIQPYHLPQADPYAGKFSTDIPSGTVCKADVAAGTVSGIVQPGCYNSFNPGNGTTNLAPGTYYLNNTGLDINGNTNIVGAGVTIIFTGTTPGSLSMNGNSTLNLSAPTSGDYEKMLFIQSSAAAAANANLINGNNGSSLDGALYFPKGQLNFTGNASAATKCAMIVGLRVDFGGNTAIQNDTTGCTAPDKVKGKMIRLIG
jgi:Flp pilus assembly protein TadG